MPDLHLVQRRGTPLQAITIDLLQRSDHLLDETQALASAVIVALGSDRLATSDDVLPTLDDEAFPDRGGWWGDLDAQPIWDGWPVGSRLWLQRRDKITGIGARQGSTVARTQHYLAEALQPFLDRKVASRMNVQAVRSGEQRIDAKGTLYRGPDAAVDLQYDDLWSEIRG